MLKFKKDVYFNGVYHAIGNCETVFTILKSNWTDQPWRLECSQYGLDDTVHYFDLLSHAKQAASRLDSYLNGVE